MRCFDFEGLPESKSCMTEDLQSYMKCLTVISFAMGMLSNVLVQDCKYGYICMHIDFINYKSKLDVMTGKVHDMQG